MQMPYLPHKCPIVKTWLVMFASRVHLRFKYRVDLSINVDILMNAAKNFYWIFNTHFAIVIAFLGAEAILFFFICLSCFVLCTYSLWPTLLFSLFLFQRIIRTAKSELLHKKIPKAKYLYILDNTIHGSIK